MNRRWWRPADIALEDVEGSLWAIWRYRDHGELVESTLSARTLKDFLDLADCPADLPDAVAAFVRAWGFLGISRAGHGGYSAVDDPADPFSLDLQGSPRDLVWGEPIDIYVALAEVAKCVLSLHDLLQRDAPETGVPLARLGELEKVIPWRLGYTGEFGSRYEAVADTVAQWLDRAKSWPRPIASDAGVTFEYPPGLFTYLGCLLADRLVGSTQNVACSGCGEPFTPERTPRSDQNHYCPACRASRVPQREAERAYRARRRAARLSASS